LSDQVLDDFLRPVLLLLEVEQPLEGGVYDATLGERRIGRRLGRHLVEIAEEEGLRTVPEELDGRR